MNCIICKEERDARDSIEFEVVAGTGKHDCYLARKSRTAGGNYSSFEKLTPCVCNKCLNNKFNRDMPLYFGLLAVSVLLVMASLLVSGPKDGRGLFIFGVIGIGFGIIYITKKIRFIIIKNSPSRRNRFMLNLFNMEIRQLAEKLRKCSCPVEVLTPFKYDWNIEDARRKNQNNGKPAPMDKQDEPCQDDFAQKIIQGINEIVSSKKIDQLRIYLFHQDPKVRLIAVEQMATKDYAYVSQFLCDLLGDPNEDVRKMVYQVTWLREKNSSCEYIVKKLKDEIQYGASNKLLGPVKARQALDKLVEYAPDEASRSKILAHING